MGGGGCYCHWSLAGIVAWNISGVDVVSGGLEADDESTSKLSAIVVPLNDPVSVQDETAPPGGRDDAGGRQSSSFKPQVPKHSSLPTASACCSQRGSDEVQR